MRAALISAREKRDRGFTLIELLVVILIIGVLTAIAVPVFLNQRKKAVDASLKADLKSTALVAMLIVEDGPYTVWAVQPELGLPNGFNPIGGTNPMRSSWGPAGSQSAYGLFQFRGAKFTGKPLPNSDWGGNRVYVGGEPLPGKWQLCAWNPAATKAVDRRTAIGYDEAQGGLIASINCAPDNGSWLALTPWAPGSGDTSWW